MAIKCFNLTQVICDDCGKSVILEKWRDAAKLGWAVPNDGAFQRCLKCTEAHKNRLFQDAKIAQIAQNCPLIDKETTDDQE